MSKKSLPLILILGLAAFFRLYRFSELFHWTLDEEFWSYLPYKIAFGHHLTLIGGHIDGTGLYSGPLFVYLMAIPSRIFSGNPLALGYTVALLGVFNCFLIYHLGKKLFSQNAGFLAALFSGGSFLMAIFDRHYWNASLTPILTTLTIWSLWEIKRGKTKFAFLLSFALALAFHAHGTGMALIIFTFLTWLVFRLPIRSKNIIIAFVIFLLLQTFLVIFDFRHGFINSRAFLAYVTTSHGGTTPPLDRLINIGSGFYQVGSRLVYFPAKDLAIEQTLGLPAKIMNQQGKPPFWAGAMFLLALIWSLGKLKKNFSLQLLWYLLGGTLAGLLIYKEKIPEYFFNPTFVPLFLIMGELAAQLFARKFFRPFIFILTACVLLLNLRNILTVRHSEAFNDRLQTVKEIISSVGQTPFTLNEHCDGWCNEYGYRYLFTVLGHEPVSSYMDPFFSWIYQDWLPKADPKLEVTINQENYHSQISLRYVKQ